MPEIPTPAMTDDYRVLVTGSRFWSDLATVRHQVQIAAAEALRDRKRPVLIHGACDPRHPDTRAMIRWDTAKRMSREVQGRYLGADWLAEWCALGMRTRWEIERHPAAWENGKAAGPRRNEAMVRRGADVMLAFVDDCSDPRCNRPRPHGSHGATHCADLAGHAGIPVRRFPRPGQPDMRVIFCRGCKRAWIEDPADPDACSCECTDPAAPLYEAWVTDYEPAFISWAAWA